MKSVARDYTIKLTLCVNILPIRAMTRQTSEYFSAVSGKGKRFPVQFRLRKQLPDGCCRPGTPRRQGPRPGTAAPCCRRGRPGRHGEPVPGRWLRLGGTREPSPEPDTVSEGSPRCFPATEAAALLAVTVRSGTEGRLCPAPTRARALFASADPKTGPFACQQATGCVAPRTGRTSQAALSFPHLAWPV